MKAQDLIYGINSVQQALKNATAVKLYVQQQSKNPRLQGLADSARAKQIPVEKVALEQLDEWAEGGRHQGCLLQIKAGAGLSLEQLLKQIDDNSLVLVLDGVTDPHNLGACLRSADATGVQAVIIPKDQSAGLTPVVRKVAAGAAESVPLIRVTNLARALQALQKAGVWLYGLAGEAQQELYQCRLSGATGIVMGAEGQGLRRLTREHCDGLLRLPMLGQVESLNVSVATGVVLYEVLRQRQKD